MLKTMLRAVAALALAFPVTLHAADLTIAIETEPAIDPHFSFVTTNIAVSRHIFDSLTRRDENMQIIPGLAESWRALDDRQWEFKLRAGVRFHDGTPLTAADVVASIERIPNVPNNPNPYTPLIRSIDKAEAVDATTLRIRTKFADPILPSQLAGVFVVPAAVLRDAQTADFRSGKSAIGSGPYRFVSWRAGERLELARFDDHWAGKQPWDRVTMRLIPNDAARLAALRARDVQVIGNVNPAHAEAIERDANLRLAKRSSATIIYLILDVARATSPLTTDKAGQTLASNPLRDPRVRRALSMAINREAIAERVMDRLALPAHQMAPDGIPGASATAIRAPYDPAAARTLLAEAGFPDGFGLTISGPNDRYLNDAKVLEAVGQMFARIGIQIRVQAEPWTVYFPKARVNPDLEGMPYSAMLIGWSHSVGDTSGFLTTVLHSFDRQRGFGTGNRSGLRDDAYDSLIREAVGEVDPQRRRERLAAVMDETMRKLQVIPLYHPFVVNASRKGFAITARMDDELLAMGVMPE
jgi:peptide/nickel transport system substrate-binding protein